MFARVAEALPHGRSLLPEAWAVRHRVVVVLLWVHAVAIAALATALTGDALHAVLEAAPVGAAAVIAQRPRLSQTVRSAVATAGLFAASALGVHLSGGYIEAHFHFFVMVGVITLYEDWIPFAVALVSTVVHHGTVGILRPEEVYNHPAAIERPVLWAAIHGAFVLAAAATHLFSWRVSEERFRDVVTRLPNRALFETRLERLIGRDEHADQPDAAVLFIDLDDFKAVNDGLGHAAGDELLVSAGQRISACLRSGDLLARVGGDEFAVLLDVGGAIAATSAAQRIIAALEKPFAVRDHQATIGSSVGIAVWDGSPDVARLLKEADTAMYVAKREGKGRYRTFAPAMDGAHNRRLLVRTELQAALEGGELAVHYQPIICIPSNDVVAVEALVRWHHPTRGLLMPSEFIPHVEGGPLITAIDRWVIAEACQQVHRWNTVASPQPPLRVHLNVSAHHLLVEDFTSHLEDCLSASGLPAELAVLQIKESVLVSDIDRARVILEYVRELGAQVAIDDFGTGSASLVHLQHLPVQVVKIDPSFVEPLGRGIESEAVARAISKLAQNLGLTVVADGVQTPQQLACVRDMGCSLAQGYLFSRPLDAETFERGFRPLNPGLLPPAPGRAGSWSHPRVDRAPSR